MQFPYDPALGAQTNEALTWVVAALNQLIGQANVQPGQGLQALSQNTIDPTTGQIISAGSRTSSLATAMAFVAQPTSISFYWDGTNGSAPLQIYRDDGTITGPIVAGSPLTVTGLSASTNYKFYPYWDDVQGVVRFATVPGAAIGSPAIAFAAGNILAAQQQILRGHILLGSTLATTGVTTPASGSSGGSGGGGGGGGSGCPLSGAPVKLYGDPAWWTKRVMTCEDFIEIVTDTGRKGTFSRFHRAYSNRGTLPLNLWCVGDLALTEQGEEQVVSLKSIHLPNATVDCYEAKYGHVYSAWGFIGHNVKIL